MRTLFILAVVLGLALAVRSMLVGIARAQRALRASIFNLPTIGAFFALFGVVGYLVDRYSTLSAVPTLAIAGASGLAASAGIYGVIAGWAVPSAAREVEDERYVLQGHFARVTAPVGIGGFGEITYELDGTRHVARARGLDDQATIPAETEVVIERVEDGVAYVELWSTIEKQLQLPS